MNLMKYVHGTYNNYFTIIFLVKKNQKAPSTGWYSQAVTHSSTNQHILTSMIRRESGVAVDNNSRFSMHELYISIKSTGRTSLDCNRPVPICQLQFGTFQ